MIGTLLAFVEDPVIRRRFWVFAVLSAFLRATTVLLLFPTASGFFGDNPADGFPWLAALAVAVVVSWWIDQRCYHAGFDVGFTLLTSVERRVVRRLERMPLPDVTPTVANRAQRAVASAGQELCQSFAYVLTPLTASMMSTVLIALGLFLVSPWLAVAALAASLLLGVAVLLSGRLIRGADARYDEASGRVGSEIVEFAQAQRVLRANRRSGTDDSALVAALADHRKASLGVLGAAIPGALLFAVVSQLALAGVAAVAVVLARQGELSGPEVVALVVVALRFLEPFFTMSDLAPALEIARGALDRVEHLLAEDALTEGEGRVDDASVPYLSMSGVTFGYQPGVDVLRDIDLAVPRGRTVAIVGPSGSGKSTLLALAARFADPGAGVVRLGGTDVASMPLEEVTSRVGVVFQDVYLVDDTLLANIRMGRPDASSTEIADAASAAQLDELIARLPEGMDTRVGEGGSLLSGGERQRVSIARALLKQAPLLLLDEATSAVDAETEAALIAALDADAGQRATLVVAHRLGTIARADEICFIEEGRIIERGTCEELLAAGGRFADYWHQREQAATWTLR